MEKSTKINRLLAIFAVLAACGIGNLLFAAPPDDERAAWLKEQTAVPSVTSPWDMRRFNWGDATSRVLWRLIEKTERKGAT